jgi:hypothetical protein
LPVQVPVKFEMALNVKTACPLSGVKRTSPGHLSMSAFDPKRTLPEKWHGIKWPVGSGIQSSLGLAILEDIAANPGSRIIDVR